MALILCLVALIGVRPVRAEPGPAATVPPSSDATAPDAAAPEPTVPDGFPVPRAEAWLLADAGTGQILAVHGLHERLAPASTIKTLSALALSPGLDDAKRLTADASDAAEDGTRIGVRAGSDYSVSDVLHGMLMSSGNDTAHMLGMAAGGIDAATHTMARAASLLGLTDTVVRTTSGLDAPDQVSSVHDLAVLGIGLAATPRLAKVATTATYQFPGAGLGTDGARPSFQIANHDNLLGRYPGLLAAKNGYTVAAHGSFVAVAERGGRRLVAVVLKAEPSTSQESALMLDWGFAHPGAAPVGRIALPPQEDWSVLAAGGVTALAAHRAAEHPTARAANPAPAAAAITGTGAAAPQPQSSGAAVAWAVPIALGLAVAVLRLRVLVRRARRRRRRAGHRAR